VLRTPADGVGCHQDLQPLAGCNSGCCESRHLQAEHASTSDSALNIQMDMVCNWIVGLAERLQHGIVRPLLLAT
jgi:hypothetical protein